MSPEGQFGVGQVLFAVKRHSARRAPGGKEGTGTEIIAETVDDSLINEIGRDSKYRVT
jgi:hypothetical protein